MNINKKKKHCPEKPNWNAFLKKRDLQINDTLKFVPIQQHKKPNEVTLDDICLPVELMSMKVDAQRPQIPLLKVLTVPKLDWNADASLDSNGTLHGLETISFLDWQKDKQNFNKIQFKQSENLSDELIAHYDEKMKKPLPPKKKKKGANKKKTSKEEPAELNYSDDEDDYDIVIESVTYVD